MTIRKLFDWPLGPSLPAYLSAFALLGCFALTGTGNAASSTTYKGVLLDKECSPNAETRMVSDPSPHLEGGMLWAYTHKRSCLLMPSCQRSGFGVLTYENLKYLTFDAAGNAKALALIQAAKKDDDMRIEVTGEAQGDTLKVSTLKILP
jgi:hypothetical protein